MDVDIFSKQYTITDTAKFLEDADVIIYDCNIHIEDNAVKYGNGVNQTATVQVGQIIWFQLKPVNLHKLFFKNASAGSAGKVSVVGTVVK